MAFLDDELISEATARMAAPPPSPDQPGGYSPVVENAPQDDVNKPGGLKAYLSNALKAYGDSVVSNLSGRPNAYYRDIGQQKRNLEQRQANADIPYKNSLTNHMNELTSASQSGRELVPFIDPTTGQPIAGEDGTPATFPRSANKSLTDFMAKKYSADQGYRGKELQFGVNVPLDDRLAFMSGHPEWAGKTVNKPMLDLITKQVSTLGFSIKDFGNEGQWLTNKAGQKLMRVGNSAAIDRMNILGPRVVQTVDANGNPIFIPTSQAAGKPVASLDPGIAGRKSYGVSLATGTEGDQVQSYRAFMGHLNDLYDYSKEFQTTGSPYANKSLNWLRNNAAGDPGISKYLAKIEPVVKEYESFLLNNRALYAEDRESGKKIVDENKTPEQIANVAKSMAHTGAIRLGSANLRYRDVNGVDSEAMVDPETKNLLDKFGQTETVNKYRKTPLGTPNGRQKANEVRLPKQALSQLKEGTVTKFRNGQSWTLKGGVAVQVNQ